ncbi:acyl-CoA dehydrogenase family protein [Candidatus Obscuribacterales bacterium]|nr:acyl-CoA dehydrogenase family protein [Candidatus Obscuribacterales bacterium]
MQFKEAPGFMLITEDAKQQDSDPSLRYSPEQVAWLKKAKAFADTIPIEDVIKSDVENSFRRDLFEKACQEGLGALPFPKTYGGTGGDYVSFCLVNEEFARRCVPIMSSLGVHVLCQEPVSRFGTEEQKQKYLVPSATGKYLAAFGLTEPNAGSDTAALETTAKFNGDHYLLNGTKTFITSGASADYYIVMAKVVGEPHKPFPPAGEKGTVDTITAFIVERGYAGFEIGQKFDMLGMRGYSTCELVFNDCKVPVENTLGDPGQGRKVALSSLAKGRVTIAAQATGWAQGALDGLIKVLKDEKSKGLFDDSLNGLASVVGELVTQVDSARVLTYQAAATIDLGEPDNTLASMAKATATDAAMKVSTEAISIIASLGLQPELLIERIFRDAKAGQIYEGTNQIQRMLIARALLR